MPLPDIDSLATYGGQMQNYAPVEDPTTDLDASAHNAMTCSSAAGTQTATRAWARFVTSATTPTLANPNDCGGTWPSIAGNKPTPSRTGTGLFKLLYPAAVTDELGNSHTLNFRGAIARGEGSTCVHAQAVISAPNEVTIWTFNAAGAANDIAGTTIVVQVF